jgi:hypothetical protein
MRFGTIQTVRQKLWQWLKDQITQEVPASDGLCEYDCRKQQCSEGEWANCERRIQRAAGELWPGTRPRPIPPQYPEVIDRSTLVSRSENQQALAHLKCAHCKSLFNCDALAQAVLAELQRCLIEYRRAGEGGPTVTEPEFIEAVRRGIDCFLRDSLGSDDYSESSPPAA